jgi:hypothetical protein
MCFRKFEVTKLSGKLKKLGDYSAIRRGRKLTVFCGKWGG